jgi:hypothetical protein
MVRWPGVTLLVRWLPRTPVWNVIRRPLDKSLDSRRYFATAWHGTSSPQRTLVVLRNRFLDEAKREEVRTHVLAISMDQKAEQTLDLDERGTYVGSLIDARTRQRSAPCIVTGYVDPLLFVNSHVGADSAECSAPFLL